MSDARLELMPIGFVESELTDPATAPKQGNEGAPDAWLVFDAQVFEGLEGIRPGDQVIVLTWLHRARRDVLQVHPRDDPANPLQGVFNTRSSDARTRSGSMRSRWSRSTGGGCESGISRRWTGRRSST
jgi:tRNA (Thr-GGU) A37 N-methylase